VNKAKTMARRAKLTCKNEALVVVAAGLVVETFFLPTGV